MRFSATIAFAVALPFAGGCVIEESSLTAEDIGAEPAALTAPVSSGCSGTTPMGATAWRAVDARTIETDVYVYRYGCHFPTDSTPAYFTTLVGSSSHWKTRGATSIHPILGGSGRGLDMWQGFRLRIRAPHDVTPANANDWNWHVQWEGTIPEHDPCVGRSSHLGWTQHGENGLTKHVRTSGCKAAGTSSYITSLGGERYHDQVVGVSSVYSPTADGFRIYLRSDTPLSPALAGRNRWHVNWRVADKRPRRAGCSGETTAFDWRRYSGGGVYVDVNTSECGIEGTILTSLQATGGWHWRSTGATSIYSPTKQGFRVHLLGGSAAWAIARAKGWRIAWTIVDPNASSLQARLQDCGCQTHPNGAMAACFTDLRDHRDNRQILCGTAALLDTSDEATKIRISMFEWREERWRIVTDALYGAMRQARWVRFIGFEKPANDAVKAGFRAAGGVDYAECGGDEDCGGRSYMLQCKGGCASKKDSNHVKMFLFADHPAAAAHGGYIAAVGSSNMKDDAGKNREKTSPWKSNNMLILSTDNRSGSLWRWLKNRWDDQLAGRAPSIGKRDYWEPSTRRAGWWSDTARGRDAWEEIAKDITCTKGAGHFVHVAMSNWDPYGRRTEFRRLLDELDDAGCDVKIAINKRDEYEYVSARVEHAQVGWRELTHDKMLVMFARFKGKLERRVVTGSHPMNRVGRDFADDVLVSIADDWLAERYEQHFDQLWGRP